MKKTIPYLLLLLFLPCLAMAPGQADAVSPFFRPGKDCALFFAVNQYDKMRPLSNPIRDAEAIAKELKDHYGFATEVVKNPTLDQIEEKLKFYQKQFAAGRFASDGQLLIFFTGHGMVENKNGFFLAKDSDPERLLRTAWAYAYWRPFLNAIGCKHILVSLDACFSGTFDPGWWSKSGFGRPGELSEGERLLAEHEKYKTRKFFTSATEVESPDDSKFAKKFLEGLRSRGGRDGILTSTELFTYLEQASPKPHAWDFGDYDPGASFLFILDNPLENPSVNLEETNALEKDLLAWKAARDANTIHAYRAYLQQFPNGEFRGLAIGRIQELEQEAANRREELAWEIAKEKNTKEAYLAYQREYPGGKYHQDAGRRMKELESSSRPPDNMAFIQGGSFEMGDTFGDGGSDEKPAHTVTVSDFEIGRHEVTVEEFSRFVNASGYKTDAEKGDGSYFWDGKEWKEKAGIDWRHDAAGKLRPSGEYNHPVIHVSWNDAVAYCNWLSDQHGYQKVYAISGSTVTPNWDANGYRLPTEAEWEFAARSRGKKEKWAGTSEENTLASYANYWEGGSKGKDGYEYTSPVGSFRPNNAGLYDMSGNVWEWCWDWYDSGYYEKSKNSRDPKGPDSGSSRVIRGGSWYSYPASVRVAYRLYDSPENRVINLGFRLARAVR